MTLETAVPFGRALLALLAAWALGMLAPKARLARAAAWGFAAWGVALAAVPRWADAGLPAAAGMLAQGFGTLGMVWCASRWQRRERDETIAAQRATIEELRAAARHDPLTGALNRRAFEGLRGAPLPGFSGAVALIDLDGFKQLNDQHGHPVGDAALQAVARALQAKLRASDYVFRWGGDEFVALLVGGSCEDAERRLTEVAAALNGARRSAEGTRAAVPMSWGVAPFADAESLDAAIAAADQQMYARRGRRSDPDAVRPR